MRLLNQLGIALPLGKRLLILRLLRLVEEGQSCQQKSIEGELRSIEGEPPNRRTTNGRATWIVHLW